MIFFGLHWDIGIEASVYVRCEDNTFLSSFLLLSNCSLGLFGHAMWCFEVFRFSRSMDQLQLNDTTYESHTQKFNE